MIESTDRDSTRERILDAAELLFAEHGFDGTSIREVTRAAGVNVAAVHYHFGSKEALLRGVADRVTEPISARRAELLARAIELASQAPDLEGLLDAFIRADVEILLELQDRGPNVARFLGRTYGDQTEWIQDMAEQQFAQAGDFYAHLAAALPHLAEDELAWRVRQVVAVIVNMFATWPEDGMSPRQAENLLSRLVVFLAGAMRAPAPPDPSGR